MGSGREENSDPQDSASFEGSWQERDREHLSYAATIWTRLVRGKRENPLRHRSDHPGLDRQSRWTRRNSPRAARMLFSARHRRREIRKEQNWCDPRMNWRAAT